MSSHAKNSTISLADDVAVLADHLAEILDVILDDCPSNKAATMLDCAERYVADLKRICGAAADAARATDVVGGVQ